MKTCAIKNYGFFSCFDHQRFCHLWLPVLVSQAAQQAPRKTSKRDQCLETSMDPKSDATARRVVKVCVCVCVERTTELYFITYLNRSIITRLSSSDTIDQCTFTHVQSLCFFICICVRARIDSWFQTDTSKVSRKSPADNNSSSSRK